MRTFRMLARATLVVGILGCGAALAWRRDPRVGTRFMNAVINPAIVRRGLAGGRSSEIGMLEHVGRRSGIDRTTPVRPVPTADGFRIVVPLGRESRWARNVLSAGHCRLRLHERTYELDEPVMVPPSMVDGLGAATRRMQGALGFQYLLLRRFDPSPIAAEDIMASAGETPVEIAQVALAAS